MIELIDVYDQDLNIVGTEDRNLVHKNGKWHYVFHCWVYNKSNNEIILQRRSATKALFPKCYDASCAGHYSSGETFQSTRELEEELGIKVKYENLIYLRDFSDEFQVENINDREIARVHLLIVDEFTPKPTTPEEIDCLVTCDFDDFIALIINVADAIKVKVVYGIGDQMSISFNELVPREFPYYQSVFALMQFHITNC